ADGIRWAVDNGADVISNSCGYPLAPCNFTNIDIENAIQYAVTSGRNGNGCVVVFAAGNQGGCVEYPASNGNVISVGAVDNRGNLYGYSARGPELDLVAPSGNRFGDVGVRTLDRMGTVGDFAGNYRDDFDGTSAACPVVSGVAALVLSRYPNLSQNEVRNILNQSATDMGAAGFDNNFGNGRVNAFAALQLADDLAPTRRIIGPTQLTPGLRATYRLSAANPDATSYNWIIPSGCHYHYCWEIINGQGTLLLSISAGNTGVQNIECKVYDGSSLIESKYITVNVQNPYNGGGGGGGDDPCGGVPNVIYPPDPCNETANVNGNSERIYFRKIVIYNFQGQTILENSNVQNLDIAHLSSGIYIIKAELSNNEMMTKKILKQ
ncbi:MAG: S8 family serine peptidase, partial [Urechidicola sp.]|nr:S8 family serine peptidase [Urechidicola sp.]